jgi:hypothetical protein
MAILPEKSLLRKVQTIAWGFFSMNERIGAQWVLNTGHVKDRG